MQTFDSISLTRVIERVMGLAVVSSVALLKRWAAPAQGRETAPRSWDNICSHSVVLLKLSCLILERLWPFSSERT